MHDAWYDFCDQLKKAGDKVFKDANAASPILRADAFRFLTQKPMLVILNVGEKDMPREAEIVASVASRYDHRQTLVDALRYPWPPAATNWRSASSRLSPPAPPAGPTSRT